MPLKYTIQRGKVPFFLKNTAVGNAVDRTASVPVEKEYKRSTLGVTERFLSHKIDLQYASDAKIDRTPIIPVFANPFLELLRLMHAAAQVEHTLILVYLNCYFSVKPDFESVSTIFFSIARDEMQHFAMVNKLLVLMGARPSMSHEEFPFDEDIFPFKYSPGAPDKKFIESLIVAEWGECSVPQMNSLRDAEGAAPNSKNTIVELYNQMLSMVDLAVERMELNGDFAAVLSASLRFIQNGGAEHATKLRETLDDRKLNWDEIGAQNYPVRITKAPPPYFSEERGRLEETAQLAISLSNLHYLLMLALLYFHFRFECPAKISVRPPDRDVNQIAYHRAHAHMAPIHYFGVKLAELGYAVPFDQLPVLTEWMDGHESNCRCIAMLCDEIAGIEGAHADLFTDYIYTKSASETKSAFIASGNLRAGANDAR